MENLKDSFEDVADWCEKHLEAQRGREIGMIFGSMLRAYGRLAMLPVEPHDDRRAAEAQQLDIRAEELLLDLSSRFVIAKSNAEPKKSRIVDPTSMRTNMPYDPGPPPKK